jgi:sugar phosphate isomerase/epimerase
MRNTAWNVLAVAGLALGALALAADGRAEAPGASPEADRAPWAPKLYGFCVDTHDAKKRSMPEQAQMLRELGFDGAGYPLWLDESLEKNLRTLDESGLTVYLLHASINVDPKSPPYDPRLPDAIRKLKGRPVTISVLLRGFPPAQSGLRISIYHHTGDWTESLLFALRVVKEVDHPQVGANFNLCHWLMVDGDKDYRPVLRENAAKIFAVTINGAKLGSKTWTNGLIQPLDQGDFDNRQLLRTLREIGYRGPIGLMCYGIPGDAREHLERSIKVWRTWEVEWTKK